MEATFTNARQALRAHLVGYIADYNQQAPAELARINGLKILKKSKDKKLFLKDQNAQYALESFDFIFRPDRAYTDDCSKCTVADALALLWLAINDLPAYHKKRKDEPEKQYQDRLTFERTNPLAVRDCKKALTHCLA